MSTGWELCVSCPSKYKLSLSDNIPIFQNRQKYTQFFRILIRKWVDFNVPLYKNSFLHYMLNPSSAEFTLHVTLQKSFSAVYALYCIWSYITESYFCCFYIYVACICSKILLLLSYIFMMYLAQSFFAGFELQVRQNRNGLASPYTFWSGIKMGDNRLLLWQQCCHANQSFTI